MPSKVPLRCQEVVFPPSTLRRATCAPAGCRTLYTCVILSHFHPALRVIHILQPKKLRLSSPASFTKHLAVVSRAVDNGQATSYTSLGGEKNQCGLMGQS